MLDNQYQPHPETEQHFTKLDLGEPQTANQETPPDPRQQNKIIAYLERGDPQVLNEHEVEVTAHERADVLEGLARGAISANEIRGLLRNINTPSDNNPVGEQRGMDRTFNLIALDPQQRGILAEFSRTYDKQNDISPFDQRNTLTTNDLAKFLADYPDPSVFEPQIEPFLASIQQQNSPEKRTLYEAKMRSFLETVYGKRYEYWEQLKLLHQEALGGPVPSPAVEQASIETAATEWRRGTTSVEEIHTALHNMVNADPAASPTNPTLDHEGRAVAEDLMNALGKSVQYARENGLPTATVVQFSDLNLGIDAQRQDIEAILQALQVVVDPQDSSGSNLREPIAITAEMLPYLADGLYLYAPDEVPEEHISFTVSEQQPDSHQAQEIHLRTKFPGVSLVLEGPGIDGRAQRGSGGVRAMLKINMNQLTPTPR